MRSLGFACIAILTATSIIAAEELPKNDEPDSFDIEPPLLIPNRDAEKPRELSAEPSATPIVDLEKLTKDIGRAERAAANTTRLFKIGALAEVEVEKRRLRVALLRAQLESARLALAKEDFANAQTRLTKHEISREEFAQAEANVARAIESAHLAEANRRRAEIEFAENDVARQQKLLGLGVGRKSDVARAEQKLNDVKACH
jgi:outer membrane protein TolC